MESESGGGGGGQDGNRTMKELNGSFTHHGAWPTSGPGHVSLSWGVPNAGDASAGVSLTQSPWLV